LPFHRKTLVSGINTCMIMTGDSSIPNRGAGKKTTTIISKGVYDGRFCSWRYEYPGTFIA
ncbi:MAG TPA: hypothetical protein VN416_10105, partial [Desulfomonilia bacterium]|nr:hypothetical protein [Desulfomonilia bacterium]